VGVADRAYMRGRGPPPIALGTSWTLRFVILLVVTSLAADAAHGWFGWRGGASLLLSRDSMADGRWWTIVTAALLHAGAFHLLFNALGLWYFGKLVEETLGGPRYVAFFWLAAALSHVPFLVAASVTGDPTPTVGASGIVMAMLVFAAFRYPGMPFRLWGLPLVLWQLAALYVGVDVYRFLAHDGGGVDYWTHLGGAAFGWSVHRFGLVPNFRLPRRARPAREPGPFAAGNAQAEIDRLLDKIAADGIGSLSEEERDFLKRNSGRYR
jgi:membrane associated rhomboid family serine protease